MDFTKLTNAVGTIGAILTVISGALASLGCSAGATDLAATCNVPFLPTSWMPILAMVFGGVLLLQKLFRPGGPLRSLFGSTAVVSADAGVGAVTPEQVQEP